MSSPFSQIVKGEKPADIVHQDEMITAFHNEKPAAPVHILIVPNEEIPTINDLKQSNTALLGHMILTAKDIAHKIGIDGSGYRLVINCNDDGGQEVFHLHLHLIGGARLGSYV
ncbi:MAG: histidine triad nucleotide-binding protein [Desulfobacteraceae bacterium]|nr:MAG: histidine triad nucleotide-binding protein [Desulfobacteraceae bacterium]